MLLRLTRLISACAILCAITAGVAAAQTSPSPAPAPTNDRTGGAAAPAPVPTATAVPGWNPLDIKGLTLSGVIRAYDFVRLNTPEYNSPPPPKAPAATGPNRYAFGFGGDLRADYKIGDSPFTIGGAFWGAYPFGLNGGSVGCNVGGKLIVNENQTLCAKNDAGFDNSLPAFPLQTFEYYLKYSDPTATIAIGDQLINKPWEPASDSRIKPSLYQAADATINATKVLSIGLTAVTQFENRTQSLFSQCTLITCTTNPGNGNFRPTTPGAYRLAIAFKPSTRFTLITEGYDFVNIATMAYLQTQYFVMPKDVYNPYFSFQFINEQQTGSHVVGNILNQTLGLQLGATPAKNFVFTVGANYAPWNYANVYAKTAAAAAAQYWLPTGGTNQNVVGGVNAPQITAEKIGPGLYKVAYGGIASPYSDSYASDPLYTTSISQGMVDRRSAGFALKGALTYTSSNKQFVAIVSEAGYNYDTNFTRNRTYELDGDVIYDFNRVRAGTYRGLSARIRLADRTEPTLPYNFLNPRFQLQYSY